MTSIFEGDFIKVDDRDLVFFDTETTGLSLLRHELIEIGYVKVKAKTFEFIEEGDIKIKPSRIESADPRALEVVGYNEAEWAHGKDIKSALEEFLLHTKDAVLVGHCLPFDWMFLSKALEEKGLNANFFYKGFDTFPLAWLLLKDNSKFEKYSLSELSKHFGIDQGQAHRAIDDARTTYELFKKLVDLKNGI